MNAHAPIPVNVVPSEAVYAARCEARALLYVAGKISLHDAVDELQTYAEQSGLIDSIGQDEAQRIMGEAFAMVDLLPGTELSDACEREIMLRAADLVQRWELADPRDRWQHTGESPPKISAEPRRREAYRPAESTVQAFWYVARNHGADYLAAWLAQHPDDRPHLFKLWKAKQC
jgi:hypothetical protein